MGKKSNTTKLSEKNKLIKDDLQNQLDSQGKFGKQYDSLLDHIVYLFQLKDNLEQDIRDNGIRIISMTGNGYKKETDNKSIPNLLNVSARITKILSELKLEEPSAEGDDNDLL